jgi:hypothetical protein
VINKRVEIVAKAMLSLAISSDAYNRKTLDECRADAAVLLATSDMIMLSQENVTNAIVDAGYEPAEYMEQFLKITHELNNLQEEGKFFNSDMEKAWAKGHENGFWDARQTDANKPSPVTPPTNKTFFTEEDVKTAEAEGYLSGWNNGILSNSELPEDSSQMPLLGAEHGKANNPYSAQRLFQEALRENPSDHAMWCKGDHEGECQRGRVTGTEGSADNG